ncbi:MAG: putative zinc-binding protein [Endomicrobiia bacterium]
MVQCCGSSTKLMFACSGCADVGEIADKTARKLNKEGFAKMSCLAGLGANLSGFTESAKGADGNITIDGCQVSCAKKILENNGLTPESFILTDFGFTKGKTDVNEENINKACSLIKQNKGGI